MKFNGHFSSDLVSVDNCFKMWIAKEGTVIPLAGYHREYVKANYAKHDIQKPLRSGDGMRLDALEAGLFRANLNRLNEELTFEGLEDCFTPTIRAALRRLVSKNWNTLGIIHIHLLNNRFRISTRFDATASDFSSIKPLLAKLGLANPSPTPHQI